MRTRQYKLKAVKISICFNTMDVYTYDLADDFNKKTDLFCIATSNALKTADDKFGCSGWHRIYIEELSFKKDAVKEHGRNVSILNKR